MKDAWSCRFLLLSCFVTFDVLATWTCISSPVEESNLLARTFIVSFGTNVGLALFGVFIAGFLFLIALFCKIMFANSNKWMSFIGNVVADACFSWFVAGVHFVGGTSWFWSAPDFMRHFLGAGVYLLILYVFMARFRRY